MNKQEFKKSILDLIDQLDNRIDELKKKASTLAEDTKDEYSEHIESLQKLKDELADKFDQFEQVSESRWDIVKESAASFFSKVADAWREDFEKVKDSKLYKIGIFSMLAIILHNIPEGIATFLTTNANAKLGITLAIAIALHNIPEGISISVPLYFGTGSKTKAILYTFISGISEFFGSILAYLFLKNIASDIFINLLYALIAGIMISLSIEELIPNANKYSKKAVVIKYILIGIIFMGIVHFIT